MLSREVLSSCDTMDQPQLVVCHREEMPEVLKAAVKSRSKLLLQEEEERRLQEEKIWREADPRMLHKECHSSLYKSKEEKVEKEEEEGKLVGGSRLDILSEEPKIEQQPSLERREDSERTSTEDISMRRISEDDWKRRSMVEEDSSRRGSLLDELREEEEMRLRLLQVPEKLPTMKIYLHFQEEHVQRVEEQAMREAVWEEECRRQQEESRWEQEMK